MIHVLLWVAICSAMPGNAEIPWPLAADPVLDGRVGESEYRRFVMIQKWPKTSVTEERNVRVWLGQRKDFLYIAAELPDSSYYWGDDFVVSFDPDGSAGGAPGDGDRQWYLRRDLDSSVVATAVAGRWTIPGHEPPPLGKKRHGDGWDVASTSSADSWTVELRIRSPRLGPMPRIAFRTYDDSPQGWWSWPVPPDSLRTTVVERTPNLWVPLVGPGRKPEK